MRRVLVYLLFATVALLATGVVTFHHVLDLSWPDAVYFALTGDGYYDLGVQQNASLALKCLSIVLILSQAAVVALVVAILMDRLFRLNLEEILGRRKRRMKDHVVLCGLGNVGVRILEHLQKMGESVIAIEGQEDARNLPLAKQMGVPVVIGDVRLEATLEEAHVADAKCLIAATDQDLANLEAALTARSLRPAIRVVMRMFDPKLAAKIRDGFGITTTFSTSGLSAPAFAMAALHPSVRGSFFVGEDLMLTVELRVAEGSRLAGMSVEELMDAGNFCILAHEAMKTGRRSLNPSSEKLQFAAGDMLIVATPKEELQRLHGMNGDE